MINTACNVETMISDGTLYLLYLLYLNMNEVTFRGGFFLLTTLDLNFLSAKIASLGLKMANQIKIL
jgi:hypothetical protein